MIRRRLGSAVVSLYWVADATIQRVRPDILPPEAARATSSGSIDRATGRFARAPSLWSVVMQPATLSADCQRGWMNGWMDG